MDISPTNPVEAVRGFNRFYTQQIGVLADAYLESPFSLSEARVIYEIAHLEAATASELGRMLGLDAGYLSRILSSFEKRELIERHPLTSDRRVNVLRLTPQGEQTFAFLNAHSKNQIETMLKKLGTEDRKRLIDAMHTIERILGAQDEAKAPFLLRPHQPGDMGWVVHLHGSLYAREYGWDEQFEALVADIAATFIREYDPKRERCWIAEREGENVGSVFLVKKSDTVAKLRMLIVDPSARGMGIGSRLVEECLRFARQVGYRKITLWTHSILKSARHIYRKAGFDLIDSEPIHSFGHDLLSETWERAL